MSTTTGRTLTAHRVALVNSRGLTAGPMFVGHPSPWSPTIKAVCDRGRAHAPPAEGCTCGVYACEDREALGIVVEATESLLSAARFVPGLDHPHVLVRDDAGMPVLIDQRSVVVVLEGHLEDAVPRTDAPPPKLVNVTRRMLRPGPLFKPARPGDHDVIFRGLKDGTEPPGTWRGARFTATQVHAVRPPSWLAALVDPLPIAAHRTTDDLTRGAVST